MKNDLGGTYEQDEDGGIRWVPAAKERRPLTSPGRVLVVIRNHETGPTATLTVRRHGGAVIGHDSAGRETIRTMVEGRNFQGPTGDQLIAFVQAARDLGYAVKLR